MSEGVATNTISFPLGYCVLQLCTRYGTVQQQHTVSVEEYLHLLYSIELLKFIKITIHEYIVFSILVRYDMDLNQLLHKQEKLRSIFYAAGIE